MLLSYAEILHFVVPFAFVFSIIYGLLSTMPKAFPKNANVILASVFGLVASIYEPTATLIFSFLPFAAVILVFLFLFVFVKKVFIGDDSSGAGKKDAGTTLAIMGLSLLAIGVAWNHFSGFMRIDASLSGDLLWIIGLAFVGLILYAGTRPSS